VLDALRREGFEPQWERVDTEAGYLASLRPDLDIILSDYNLPEFSAPRALKLLQERHLELPFIIISGTIEEDVAVSAMKQGAADYLLKDRLARLGASVTQAVEQSRLRRERQEAVEHLRLFRMLVDQSNDAFEVIDPQTACFLDVSEKGCVELGFSRAEYRERRVFDIDSTVAESDWPALVETIRTAGVLNREGRYTRKMAPVFRSK